MIGCSASVEPPDWLFSFSGAIRLAVQLQDETAFFVRTHANMVYLSKDPYIIILQDKMLYGCDGTYIFCIIYSANITGSGVFID